MAGTRSREDRRVAGKDRPRSDREGQGVPVRPILHAARRSRPRRPTGRLDAERVLSRMKGIADTGFLVAFARQNDIHHEWAVGLASRVADPLLTCEAVLAETAFHLQNVSLVLAMLAEG